jgi:predicted dehydrogenase
MKGAVIGYGFISGKGHIPAYLQRSRQDVQIIAVADINEARRELARKVLPEARIYSNYQDLLKAEARNLDFVDISTPPCDHAEIAHAVFDAGLHVLCEKPITTTLEEATLLLEKAKKVKRVFFPCHNYKHAPVVKAIREVIESGRIGEVRSVNLSTYRNTHAKGVTEWNTHWRRFHEFSGGGIAMDHGSHSFYLTFDWLKSYPTAITAKMSNLEPAKYDTEDNFTTVLTFPNGLAHCSLSWTAGVRKVIYTIQGTTGAITVDDDDMQISIQEKTSGPDVAQGAIRWNTEKKTIESDWMDASHVTWFNAMFDQFITAIQQNDYVGKEAQEAYRCIEIITQAYASAKQGCQELKLLGISS